MIIYNYGEVILAFTGYISIYLYLYLSSNIGLIVAINSLLCHLSLAINHYHKLLYKNIDIITNVILIIYVNLITKWQPQTLIISILVAILFIVNHRLYLEISIDNIKIDISQLFHILGIQFPCLFCLYKSIILT